MQPTIADDSMYCTLDNISILTHKCAGEGGLHPSSARRRMFRTASAGKGMRKRSAPSSPM